MTPSAHPRSGAALIAMFGLPADRAMRTRDRPAAQSCNRRLRSDARVPLRLIADGSRLPGTAGNGPDRRLLLLVAASLVAHVVGALLLTVWPTEPVPLEVAREWAVTLEPVPEPVVAAPDLPAEERRSEVPMPPAPEPERQPATPAPQHQAAPVSRPAALPRHDTVRAPPAERRPPARPAESPPAAVASLRPLTPDAPVVPPPIVPPHPLAGMQGNPPPAYPERSRQRREQGLVLLRVDVSADGVAASVTVAHSSGYRTLDEAAAATVRRWRFVAATRGGTAIAAVAEVPVQFTLAE